MPLMAIVFLLTVWGIVEIAAARMGHAVPVVVVLAVAGAIGILRVGPGDPRE